MFYQIVKMPELPEVETIVRELKTSLKGKTIKNIQVKSSLSVYPSLEAIIRNARGYTVLDVRRRGKFIILVLNEALRLVVHLRMTGRLMWSVNEGRAKYVRVVINFVDETSLFFSDVRKFGRVWFYTEKDYKKGTGISRLGYEPLKMELAQFCNLFEHRKGILKNSLLRQDLISGIGNIYADEICFKAGLHPKSRLEHIKKQQIVKLYESVQVCLREGIKNCGVSVRDFVGTKGDLGKHQNYLRVYGRKGVKCYKCGSIIEKTVVAGRGTFYCPKCQRL